MEIYFVQHIQRAVAQRQLLGIHHHTAGVRRRRELEGDGTAVVIVNLDPVHLLQHLDATLHLPRLGGLVAETLNETLNLGNLLLLVFVGSLLVLNTLQPLLHILRVAALVVLDGAAGDLHRAVGATV